MTDDMEAMERAVLYHNIDLADRQRRLSIQHADAAHRTALEDAQRRFEDNIREIFGKEER